MSGGEASLAMYLGMATLDNASSSHDASRQSDEQTWRTHRSGL